MLTIEDIRNPARPSGFNYVSNAQSSGGKHPLWCAKKGKFVKGSAANDWHGPCRRDPEVAAQDFCDYMNGRGAAPATLKTAGHKYRTRKTRVPSDIEAARGMIRDWEAQQRGDVQGYVYAITDGEFVKIGYSVNPEKRIAELQTGNARVLSLLGTMEGTERDERKLHAKYKHLNVLQEWFEIDSALIAEFNPPAAVQRAA